MRKIVVSQNNEATFQPYFQIAGGSGYDVGYLCRNELELIHYTLLRVPLGKTDKNQILSVNDRFNKRKEHRHKNKGRLSHKLTHVVIVDTEEILQ